MNTPVTTTSKQFTLNISDVWKGLIMAVILPVLTIIMNSINQGSLTFNWTQIAIAAIGGLIGYLIKNFFTPSSVTIQNPVLAEKVKEGDAEVKVIEK